MAEERRILAGVALVGMRDVLFPTNVHTKVPLDRLEYNHSIDVSLPFSKFITVKSTSNIVIRYNVAFRTTRRGSRVEVPIYVGILVNGVLQFSEISEEPYWVNNDLSGIRGKIVLIGTHKTGSNISFILINKGISCELEVHTANIAIHDRGAKLSIVQSCSHIHEQGIASDHWVMDNPLDFFPNITTVTKDLVEFKGTVSYPDADTVTVDFKTKMTGLALFS